MNLRVGPAGWSYEDWSGIVYPRGRTGERLRVVAGLFRTLEINSSFYHPPSARTAASWVEKLRDVEDFVFTAKLVRAFTHEDPRTWTLAIRDTFRDGMAPLKEAGRLGALLVQFPFFYDAREANRHRLSRIRKAFPDDELVLEVRHRSWLEHLEEVSSLGYSFCNADLPHSSTSIPLEAQVTGPVGYLRLHGRNAAKWFAKGSSVEEKYDYLYSEAELAPLIQIAQKLREKTENAYVIANNHFEGKGPANALEVAAAFGTAPREPLPPGLVERYPRLASLT